MRIFIFSFMTTSMPVQANASAPSWPHAPREKKGAKDQQEYGRPYPAQALRPEYWKK
jgi:hypothetical protein